MQSTLLTDTRRSICSRSELTRSSVRGSPSTRRHATKSFAVGSADPDRPESQERPLNSVQSRLSRLRWGKLPWPQRLIALDAPEQAPADKTVYTIRIKTSTGQGAGIDEPGAGVYLGLVFDDGATFLNRISPLYDPASIEEDLHQICQVADKSTGANCRLALRSAASSISRGAQPKVRFQPGSIDEVSLLGPEQGPLRGLLAGAQVGSWHLDEAIVSSSRTGHIDRFICREVLGRQAAYLSPVPAGKVVYGSGANAVILTREQAGALYAVGMLDYGALKGRLTIANAALVAVGTTVAAMAGGWDTATPFAVGGATGLLYQILLQRTVDALPTGQASMYPAASPSRFTQAMSSGYSRFTFILVATLASIHALDLAASPHQFDSAQTTIKFFTGAAGFLMWKVAVIGVAAMPLFGRGGGGRSSSPPPTEVPASRPN